MPPSLKDQYGKLRKGDKYVSARTLWFEACVPPDPDVVLFDEGQLLHHVVWPVNGTTGELTASFGNQLFLFPQNTKKPVLFDKYDEDIPSPKQQEKDWPNKFIWPQIPHCQVETPPIAMLEANIVIFWAKKKPPSHKKLPRTTPTPTPHPLWHPQVQL